MVSRYSPTLPNDLNNNQNAKTNRRMKVLGSEMIVLGAHATSKTDAIRQAGDVLIRNGCVAPSYVDGMLARERVLSTYLGNGIALPHGELADLQAVYQTGVSVLQFPEGIEWEPGEWVYLVIGLASNSDEHVRVLINLTRAVQEPKIAKSLAHARDPMVIIEYLTQGLEENGVN